MRRSREVVITGVGVVSPIGIGWDAYVASLRERRSGVVELPEFQGLNGAFHIGAPLKGFDAKEFVQPRKALKVMSREIQAAYVAAELAMRQAGIAKGTVDPNRFGVVVGSEVIYGEMEELKDAYLHAMVDGVFHHDLWGKSAMQNVFPLWMLKYLPNMPACHIGIAHDAHGPNNTITLGEASGLIAIGEAMSYIQRDIADVVLVGATGSRINHAALSFRGCKHNSRFVGDPTQACKPFDAARDGYVNGEGAGVLVLESLEHAEKRGGKPLARIAAQAVRYEAIDTGTYSGRAIRQTIEAVLQQSGLAPRDIGHVKANGLATVHDDRVEARAINDVLADVPVTAPKSFFGNLGAGAAIVEAAAGIAAIRNDEIPVTLNYERPDADCPINVVAGDAVRGRPRTAVLLNQSYSGQAAAVLITEA